MVIDNEGKIFEDRRGKKKPEKPVRKSLREKKVKEPRNRRKEDNKEK